LKEGDRSFYEKKFGNKNIKEKACVIPIAIMRKKSTISFNNNKNVLFAAQLSYGPNKEGLLKLVTSVWNEIAKMGFTLLVAGGNADKRLKEILKVAPNIKTFYDPTEKEMEKLYEEAFFSIAPVFWGSGMKVKIAESLASGIVPIGTPEAFSGYEIENNKNAFVFEHVEELCGIFKRINEMTVQDRQNMSRSALALFEKKYEISTCVSAYKKFIHNTIKGKSD